MADGPLGGVVRRPCQGVRASRGVRDRHDHHVGIAHDVNLGVKIDRGIEIQFMDVRKSQACTKCNSESPTTVRMKSPSTRSMTWPADARTCSPAFSSHEPASTNHVAVRVRPGKLVPGGYRRSATRNDDASYFRRIAAAVIGMSASGQSLTFIVPRSLRS